MRVAVDPWDPSYGSATEVDGLAAPTAEVNLAVEVPVADWSPRRPDASALVVPETVVFVDGVRRIDARVWISGDAGDGSDAEAGLCASWAAGAVRCAGGRADVAAVEVGRGLFSASRHAVDVDTAHGRYRTCMARSAAPDALSLALQERMTASEVSAAASARGDGEGPNLLVIDGPLRGRQHLAGAVGMIKTHHTAYLSGSAAAVLVALAPGERTPAFTVGTNGFTRHSWYLRLPGRVGTPLAGVVRCECAADVGPAALAVLADVTAVLLPRFASEAHKDARAPQNLYPIGGLERQLRHRLGDGRLLYRALRAAVG